jgi:hypothetical protein
MGITFRKRIVSWLLRQHINDAVMPLVVLQVVRFAAATALRLRGATGTLLFFVGF